MTKIWSDSGRSYIERHKRNRLMHVLCAIFAQFGADFSEAFAQDLPGELQAMSGGPFDCLIQASALVKVGASVSGLIEHIPVDRGDTIKKGDLIAELESGLEKVQVKLARARSANEQEVRTAQAKLQLAEQKLTRISALTKTRVASTNQLNEAEAEVSVAASQLRSAEENRELASIELEKSEILLEQRKIRSPVNGLVVERLISLGEYHDERSPLMTLAQIDPLYIEVVLPLSEFHKVTEGMKTEIVPEEPVGGKFRALVKMVDRNIDSASGTFGVRLELPNPDLSIPAGLRCSARFISNTN